MCLCVILAAAQCGLVSEEREKQYKSSQAAKIRIHESSSLPLTPQRFLSAETIDYKSVSVSGALHVKCTETTLFCVALELCE